MCWLGFCVPVCFEIYVHILHGFSRQEILGEEDALPPELSGFLDFSELICRVCLAQVMMATFFFLLRALIHNKVRQGWKQLCGKPRQYVPALLFSLITFAVGLWGCIVGDEDLPLWALRYSHICDMFCHAIVSSALMGFSFDFAVALYKGKLMDFLKNFVRCDDTIEAHGVATDEPIGEMHHYSFETFISGSQSRSDDVKSCRRRARQTVELLLMWASWIFIFISYTLSWERPDLAPAWMTAMVDFIGRFCWAGITFWIVSSLGARASGSEGTSPGTSSSLIGPRMEVFRQTLEERCKECENTVGVASQTVPPGTTIATTAMGPDRQ